MCPITRTASAILLLCYATIPAQRAAAIDPRPTHLHRHLQEQTTETIFTISTDTSEPQDATIRGKVYNDLNLNGQQEATDPPVAGVVAKLFLCTNGSRVGITRTNDDGDYLFTIPGTALPPSSSSSKGCYYIQYTVNNMLPNAIFTAPQNGETNDIFLRQGGMATNVDAGIFGSTDSPSFSFQWATYSPTTNTNAPSPAPFVRIPMTVMTSRPESSAPTVRPSGSPIVTVRPTDSPMVTITLPLPTETVFIPDDTPIVVASVSSVAPTQAPAVPTQAPVVSIIWSTFKPTSSPVLVVVNDEAGTNDFWGKEENEQPEKQEIHANETKPSKNEEASSELKEEQVSSDTDTAEKGTLNLKSQVLIQLSNLQSEISQIDLFEEKCGEFLNEELAIATPPIYDLKCQVLGQMFEEGRQGGRTLRALAESNLQVQVEVTGEVKKTPSTQEPDDVPFDALLVGTFTVQGYLFAEALKEEEKLRMEEGASEEESYFGYIGNVRGVNTNSAERQEGEESDGDTVFTKGVIAATVVGGFMVLLLLLLIGVKATRRSKSSGSASGAARSGSKRSANKSNAKAGTKSVVRSRDARSKKPSTSPSGSPKSITSYVTASRSADSEDVEVGLDPAIRTAIPPKSTSRKPTRIRRDIVAPSGKLGIMVANTTTGYGPAVHTLRPGSPMEGLIYVNDIIVGVNDVDTRKYSAGQITQVMKDTVGEERKISVLSTVHLGCYA